MAAAARAALKLHRLAQARQRPHGDAAGARVGAQQIANQKVPAVEVLQVLVDDQPDEQVAARALLLLGRELVERLRQHLVGGAVADLVDDILLDLGEGPRLADGRAALGSHAHQLHVAADRDRHAAFVIDLAVQIHLGRLLVEIAAGQPAEDRQRGISFVPGSQPRFAVQVERINEGQPAVGLAGLDLGFQMPVAGAVGFLDLLLREVNRLQLGAGQGIQAKGQARVLLHLMVPDDQALTRTPGQQRNPGMHTQNLQHLLGAGKESRGHEDQPERHLRRGQLGAQTLRPLLEARLVEVARPVRRRGILVAHKANLPGKPPIANPKTELMATVGQSARRAIRFHCVISSVAMASTGSSAAAVSARASPSPAWRGQMWKPPCSWMVISQVPQMPLPSRKPR